MKNFSLLPALALLLAACSPKAHISGTVAGAPGRQIELRRLNINAWEVLDSIKTDSRAAFRYNMKLGKGNPEFVYLFSGGKKIASLVARAGDRIRVEADTLGNFTVQGSEDSELLRQTDSAFAAFASRMAALDERGGNSRKMAEVFIDHYREATRFVLGHPYSIVNVPVLYERINEYTPVFNQHTDAILFRRATDSLKTVYPDSPYVRALEEETRKRENALMLMQRLGSAGEAAYPDLTLPGMDGKDVALSEVDARAVLLHFWNPADAEQKMFNLDVLMPLYERWHGRGLEIYSVAVSADKPSWAAVVNSQKLPWINVCDGKGAYSPSLSLYGVDALPWSALVGGENGVEPMKGVKAVERALAKLL